MEERTCTHILSHTQRGVSNMRIMHQNILGNIHSLKNILPKEKRKSEFSWEIFFNQTVWEVNDLMVSSQMSQTEQVDLISLLLPLNNMFVFFLRKKSELFNWKISKMNAL